MIAESSKHTHSGAMSPFMIRPRSPRFRHADRALRSVSDIIAYSAGGGAVGGVIGGPVGAVTGSSLVAIAAAALLLSQRSGKR